MLKRGVLGIVGAFVVVALFVPAGAEALESRLKQGIWDKPMNFSDPAKDPTKPAVGGVRWFWSTHARNYERRKAGNIDLIFLGDSITQGWPSDLFAQNYGNLNAVNFGCGGDKIQHTLMRLEGDDGEIRGTTPKVIVLMLGVNNMADNSAEEIAYGIANMVKRLLKECPQTKVLLMGILPTRDGDNEKIKAVNKLTATLENRKNVRFLDIGSKFYGKDRKIKADLFRDGVHLNRNGYVVWGDAMNPLLKQLMRSR